MKKITKNPNTEIFWRKKIENTFSISQSDFITKDRISKIVNLLPKSSLRLLDVGVGYGFFEIEVKRGHPKFNIFGIDITIDRLIKLKREGFGNFIGGTIVKIPFQSKSFDYVCFLEVLEHLCEDDGQKALAEAFRVLKENGVLIISVPLFDKPIKDHPSGHVREITPKKIIKEIKEGGFEIRKLIPLVAFKSHYLQKSILNKILPFRRPNNLVIEAYKP